MWISRKRNSHPLCYSLLTRFFYSHASPSSSSSFLCLPRSLFAVGVCEVLPGVLELLLPLLLSTLFLFPFSVVASSEPESRSDKGKELG
ncbi:uncharacterized protein LOC129307738 isoform X2 [Prosopis cineraria]|uniref:uncharacterized protein LOC129307738 isoform X2 n=1 Tax=Prosopis cineraria TaxID=364024 RepID=UPI00240EDBE1|nr:uncharacterized protein LOC129307738 isoform X2 [Prosopis cineraria]